jgi:hypothetical protein
MDTCHSGTITRELRVTNPRTDKAMMVMAACLSKGVAHERDDWKHGALTLALLEAITGRHHYKGQTETALPGGASRSGVINLHNLGRYVEDRVRELLGGRQAVVMNRTGNFDYTRIAVATLGAGKQP